MHILFCRQIWAELSVLFWTFLSGTFFPRWGGGGGGGGEGGGVLVLKRDFYIFHLYSLFASSKSNYLQIITLFVPFKLENSDNSVIN